MCAALRGWEGVRDRIFVPGIRPLNDVSTLVVALFEYGESHLRQTLMYDRYEGIDESGRLKTHVALLRGDEATKIGSKEEGVGFEARITIESTISRQPSCELASQLYSHLYSLAREAWAEHSNA